MNAILWWLGQNAIAVALLIPLVALVCRLFRNRPAAQHVLWVILLLKFITPPIVSWPVYELGAWPFLQRAVLSSVGSGPPKLRGLSFAGIATALKEDRDAGTSAELTGATIVHADATARASTALETFTRISLWSLWAAWLLGVAVCAIKQFRRIVRHARIVKQASDAPRRLQAEIEAIAAEVGLKPPRAVVTGGIASPFMWFLGRLRLVWPQMMSNREAIERGRGVIAHELAHVRRGDHLLAWVELVAGLFWWWNPLFWFVRRRVRESAELACDAIALGACPEGRRTYAEILIELSSDLDHGAPAPALGISARSTSSFERRLSMILSDRVKGRMSVWGLVAAGSLAIAALPGWSFAQKPAQSKVAASADIASEGNQVPSITAAQIEQIESDLKRITGLLEQAKQSTTNRQMKPARFRRLKVIEMNSLSALFEGSERNYLVSKKETEAFVKALDRNGRPVWEKKLPGSLPRNGGGTEWVLSESEDGKQIMANWIGGGKLIIYHLDAATGMLRTHIDRRGDDDLDGIRSDARVESGSQVGESSPVRGEVADRRRIEIFQRRIEDAAHAANRAISKGRGVRRAPVALAFGGGPNRIYILNTEANDSENCFLSAQTDLARQVWRATFSNPLLTDRFRNAWNREFHGPLPSSGLAGYWRVEESDDQQNVQVTWTGAGMRVRICFDIASGELNTEEFTPEELGKKSAVPGATNRATNTVAEPRR